MTEQAGLTRRHFLSGLAATGFATMGIGVLAGCSGGAPKTDAGASGTTPTPTKKKRTVTGVDVGGSADPIESVGVPAAWDEEADVVVVGTGGGLTAACYALAAGKKVVVLEKAAQVGGTSKETDIFSVMGTKTQQAIYQALGAQLEAVDPAAAAQLTALGQTPPEMMRQMWLATYLPKPNDGDEGELPDGTTGFRPCAPIVPMLNTLVNCIPEAVDFMGQAVGVPWGPVTMFDAAGMISGLCPQGSEQGGIVSRANYSVFTIMRDYVLNNGGTIHLSTPATALIMDGDRVVGVQCEGEVTNVRAKEGVILATGGMTYNEELLREYCPHVYHRCMNSTAASSDTGDGIRMGLGAGAAISGYDSSFVFDGGVDCGTWGHYLYKGDTQLARQPWLSINIMGERVPYYPVTTLGFTKQAGIHMHNPGNCSYVFFDSHFDEIIKNWDATGKQQFICRNPITREKWAAAGKNVERIGGMTDEDYTIGMQQGLDAGYIYKADTIAELAQKIGLDANVLQGAVANWNAMCDAGTDPLYHYDPAWLIKVQDGPFYGMKVGGTILATMCGLTVNTNMQVMSEKGLPIPGLYAAGCTAGGLGGDSSYGDCRNPGGGVAMSCGTAYQAAKHICGELA